MGNRWEKRQGPDSGRPGKLRSVHTQTERHTLDSFKGIFKIHIAENQHSSVKKNQIHTARLKGKWIAVFFLG